MLEVHNSKYLELYCWSNILLIGLGIFQDNCFVDNGFFLRFDPIIGSHPSPNLIQALSWNMIFTYFGIRKSRFWVPCAPKLKFSRGMLLTFVGDFTRITLGDNRTSLFCSI